MKIHSSKTDKQVDGKPSEIVCHQVENNPQPEGQNNNRGETIVAKTVNEPKYTLEELLEGVTDENLHGEIDWGSSVGKEVW